MFSREDLIKVARGATTASVLAAGKTKLSTEDVLERELTITDVEHVQYKDGDGADVSYYVVLFKEIPDGYYNAGKVLGEIAAAFVSNGMLEELRQYGLHIRLSAKRAGNGKRYTSVDILD